MSQAVNAVDSENTRSSDVEHVYSNTGNAALIDMLDAGTRLLLDVGCGAGDNAVLITTRFPACEVHGITWSSMEARIAAQRMSSCAVWDIEGDVPDAYVAATYDAIVFSHVLEHMRHPAAVLQKFLHLLKPGGTVLIAVPNALSWVMRWRFMRGDFEYGSEGVLDSTHLRFFTFWTADRYLLGGCPQLTLVAKRAAGSVPLWWIRRYLLPKAVSDSIDRVGVRRWPNLFGTQVLLKAIAGSTVPLRAG